MPKVKGYNVTSFWDDLERQALVVRRQMVDSGELLTEDEFRERLHVSARRLAQMVAAGSVFAIEVDGVSYFPALLAAPEIDQRRLRSICRVLVAAHPDCRYHFLMSKRANIGGITPVDALHDDKQYRLLRRMASAYAVEWSRTSVSIYAGRHESRPTDIGPIVTVAQDVDLRTNLWKRVAVTLQVHGYIHPCGPYPFISLFTAFVERHTSGEAKEIPEARIHVSIVDSTAKAFVIDAQGQRYELKPCSVSEANDVIDVVLGIAAIGKVSAPAPSAD